MKPIPVKKYDLDGNLLAIYNGLREAARNNGLKTRTLADHVVSHTPLGGYLWDAPSHQQPKAERSRMERERKKEALRAKKAIDSRQDMERLQMLIEEPLRGKIVRIMQQALDRGGLPRYAFAFWYTHQYEIDIASDDITWALGYPSRHDSGRD